MQPNPAAARFQGTSCYPRPICGRCKALLCLRTCTHWAIWVLLPASLPICPSAYLPSDLPTDEQPWAPSWWKRTAPWLGHRSLTDGAMYRVLSRARSGQVDGRHSWQGVRAANGAAFKKRRGRMGAEFGSRALSRQAGSSQASTGLGRMRNRYGQRQPASTASTAQDGTAPHRTAQPQHLPCTPCHQAALQPGPGSNCAARLAPFTRPHRLTGKELCAASRRAVGDHRVTRAVIRRGGCPGGRQSWLAGQLQSGCAIPASLPDLFWSAPTGAPHTLYGTMHPFHRVGSQRRASR